MTYTQIATDNFTRADGFLGSNWNPSGSGWTISSDQAATPSTNAITNAYWVGSGSFTNNQYAIITVGPSNGVNQLEDVYMGSALQVVGSQYYNIICNGEGGNYYLIKNGSTLTSGSMPTHISVRDTIELDFNNGVLAAYHNGVQICTYTDSSPLTGGVPGMCADPSGGYMGYYSDWVGGNISVGIPGALTLLGCGAS